MSDTPCIWTGSETPRALRGRHLPGCLVDPLGPKRAGAASRNRTVLNRIRS